MKYIMITVLAIGLSACGQTMQGVGKDIVGVGQKVIYFGKDEKKSEDEKKSD